LLNAPVLPEASIAAALNPIRVLIVDDSAVMRRLLTEVMSEDPAVEVVGTASTGLLAIQQIERLKPDVITLDVEMPQMDGIAALKHIKERNAATRVVMLSSLTERGRPATLEALLHGASDYCAKPSRSRSAGESKEYLRRELLPKVCQFRPAPFRNAPRQFVNGASPTPAPQARAPQALVIAASTGGPQALALILPMIPKNYPLPILIVQHMSPDFTRPLAQRLNSVSGIAVEEAASGQLLRPGLALIAPGGYHLRVRRSAANVIATLDREPLENSCRPAADVLFRSAAEVWGGNVIAAILTGMGHDGLRGTQSLWNAGAWVVAQDEGSSIVWGMPGAVASAGLAHQVLDIHRIIPAVLKRSRIAA
jgi:two-component system, chemotaxis family, protein-glutamate methylesterase/glutaminase